MRGLGSVWNRRLALMTLWVYVYQNSYTITAGNGQGSKDLYPVRPLVGVNGETLKGFPRMGIEASGCGLVSLERLDRQGRRQPFLNVFAINGAKTLRK